MQASDSTDFDAPPADIVASDRDVWSLYAESMPAEEREPREVILASVRAGDTLELSPDASLLAIGSGELFSPSDLTPRGTIDRGALGFSGDSRYVATAVSEAELDIFSAATFTKTLIVETDCGQAAAGRVIAIPEQDAWVLQAGSGLCRFNMPHPSQTSAPALKTSLGSGRYFCGDDCVARKRVAPAVMRASELTRYLPWTLGGAVVVEN